MKGIKKHMIIEEDLRDVRHEQVCGCVPCLLGNEHERHDIDFDLHQRIVREWMDEKLMQEAREVEARI